MTTSSDQVEALVLPGHLNFKYDYFAGEAASRFFAGLRERRILGTVCPSCHRVLVPARSFCDACFEPTNEWREVGLRGRLEAFTILTRSQALLPPPPVVIGYVLLETASTALLNVVTGIDLEDLDVAGNRLLGRPEVQVVFHDEIAGRINDFHFSIVGWPNE